MPWFSFTTDFDFRPTRRVTLAYKAGTTLLIPTAAAEAAEAAGAGKRAPKPKVTGGMVAPGPYGLERGPGAFVPLGRASVERA